MNTRKHIAGHSAALTEAWRDPFLEYVRVVEEFSFCPFSRATRERERLAFLACDGSLRANDLCELLDAHRVGELEVLLVAFPEDSEPATFARRVEESRSEHQRKHGGMTFALEAFLPLTLPETLPTSMGELVRIARHTPCPAVQCTRLTTLERARGERPDQTKFLDPSLLSAQTLDALLAKPNYVDLTTRVHEEMQRNLEASYPEIRARLQQIERLYSALMVSREPPPNTSNDGTAPPIVPSSK